MRCEIDDKREKKERGRAGGAKIDGILLLLPSPDPRPARAARERVHHRRLVVPPPHMKEGESENDTLDARAHSSVNVPVKALATPTRAMVAMVVRRVMVESIILFPLAGVKSKNGGTTE